MSRPINSTCREMIQQRVIDAFSEEIEQAELPGYTSRYDEFDHDEKEKPAEPRRDAPAPHHPPSSLISSVDSLALRQAR